MRKKRVLFHSDFSLAKTGFGRVMKALLSYLYKTNKYELHHLCCGVREGSQELNITPWKSYGAVPSNQIKLQQASSDPQRARSMSYGSETIDEIILNIKPDIYIGTQDFWGVDFTIEKPWFNKITSCIWTTLDSLPILPSAVKKAKHIKNYWVWSSFAEKALAKLGNQHVKTVHGPIDDKPFFRLKDEDRLALRNKHNIPADSMIIGFVFRNQLRKSVPNLLEGYKIWKDRHPEIKNTRLLLHTSFSEGWNIKAQADQYGVNTKEILTTYICHKCENYEVKSFDDRIEKFEKKSDGSLALNELGQNIEKTINIEHKDCKICKTQKSQQTTNVGRGVTEEQLNEIYNLMDVYVHPFTSGGQEIPIQEAKLTELITLVTNYSCGEESCEKGSGSLPLLWNKYIEHGTEFIKASTCPVSIADQLDVFINLSKQERAKLEKIARSWSLDNFSVKRVGKFFEKFIDSAPEIDENLNIEKPEQDKKNENPNAEIDDKLPDIEWLKSMYKNILDRPDVPESDDGLQYWMTEISKGAQRMQIQNYFRNVAQNAIKERLQKTNPTTIDDLLEKNNKKRILYTMPQSIGGCFLSTSILSSLREIYTEEEWDIYISSNPEFKNIFNGNRNITKWLPHHPQMEDQAAMEGIGKHNGWFNICFSSNSAIKKITDYSHNAQSKLLM